MNSKKILIILVLLGLFITNIRAKRCNSCCSKQRCTEKEQNHLKKIVSGQQKELDMFKSKTIYLEPYQMIQVYDDNNNLIGNIVDEMKLNWIGKNMRIVPRISPPNNSVVLYTDINMRGVYISLLPGRYTSEQISLPKNSISSISIPENIEVVLYSNDHFGGNSILVSNNVSTLEEYHFNDKFISIEILVKENEKSMNIIGAVFYNPNFNGKQISLVEGMNQVHMYQIRSLKVQEDYQIKVYHNSDLIDIIDKNITDISLPKSDNGLYQLILSKINPRDKLTTIILYKDIHYHGKKYYMNTYNKTHFNYVDSSISSIQIPLGFHLQIFDKDDYTGSSIIIAGNISNLKNYAFNDRIRSFITYNHTQFNNSQVILYSEPNYKGNVVYVPIGFTKCDIHNNDFNGMCKYGSYQNRASSIGVPRGYKVTLEKKQIFWENNIYYYTENNSNIQNWIDTPIVSIEVREI
jgi:hypothetical protein